MVQLEAPPILHVMAALHMGRQLLVVEAGPVGVHGQVLHQLLNPPVPPSTQPINIFIAKKKCINFYKVQ